MYFRLTSVSRPSCHRNVTVLFACQVVIFTPPTVSISLYGRFLQVMGGSALLRIVSTNALVSTWRFLFFGVRAHSVSFSAPIGMVVFCYLLYFFSLYLTWTSFLCRMHRYNSLLIRYNFPDCFIYISPAEVVVVLLTLVVGVVPCRRPSRWRVAL